MPAPLNQLPGDVIGIGAAVTRREAGMPDVAAAENPSQLAPPEPGLRHRLPHRSAGSADRIPAGTTANAGPIDPRGGGRAGDGGSAPPPPPATPPCVRVRTRRFETVTLAFLE